MVQSVETTPFSEDDAMQAGSMMDCRHCCWEHTLQKSTPKDAWHCLRNFAVNWDRAW